MTFAEGDVLDFADTYCALRVILKKYSVFAIKEDGMERPYERFLMSVRAIFKDGQEKYRVGHEFVRERLVGESNLEWSLTKPGT